MRSPVRVTSKILPLIGKVLKFTCDDRLRGVKLQDRKSPDETAIVARSSKNHQLWQLTFFRSGEPWGDVQYATCAEALDTLSPRRWRLRSVR